MASSISTYALLLTFFTTLVSFFFITSRSKQKFKNGKKLPPGPRPLPIIGNLHMLGQLPHRSLSNLAKKYGSIMSIRLGNVPTIVVSSPEAAELFLKVHDVVFASRPKLQFADYVSYGNKGLAFAPYGSYWRTVRKWCTSQLLSSSKVELFEPIRRREVESLMDRIKRAAASGQVVDLSAKAVELMENIMYRMIIGRSKDDKFDLKPLIQEILRLSGHFNIADYVPFLAPLDLQDLVPQFEAIREGCDNFLEEIINEHQQDKHKGQKKHRDFVDVMLSHLDQPMNPNDESQLHIIDRTNIKAIILDMITGALDTSTVAIEWAFSEILKHPRVKTHLQKELEGVVGMTRMVEEADLPKLTYLDMVLKESLRLHPVAPLLMPRESLEDITINEYHIPKKSRILINTWAIGRDSNVWSDNANDFFPERFVNSNIDIRGHNFQLIPFGSGRRGCPGMQMGLTNVRLVLAQLVHCFEWELPDGMLPSDLSMSEKFGLTAPRAKHLLAMPVYRLQD
ncbi:Cytochrome P450 superfamily protein [Gossypium australe]|uniref:Cytochrome P450 superfamily protein n=1 Tax=Gossypium australe TaxID=47621 RepID=A0A5B6UD87_9ROSI|nr:Cytochrome P450 superfamily protein [Gossypium australe]